MKCLGTIEGYSLETIDEFANFEQMPMQRGYIVGSIPDFGKERILLIWLRHDEICKRKYCMLSAYDGYYQVETLLVDTAEMNRTITDNGLIGTLLRSL